MHQRATFEHLKTEDPEIFAIRVGGHLTPRQKGVVEQFMAKCRETGKRKVLFDFSALDSLGGGVAQLLGEFAVELAREGCPPWFVGARGIVRKFLTARFSEGEPCFAATLEEAVAAMAEAGKPAGTATAMSVVEPEPSLDEGQDFLQIVEAVNETAGVQREPEPEPFAAPPVRPPGADEDEGGYISLDEALERFGNMHSLPEAESVLTRLLHSSSLASRSFLFLRNKDGFRHGEMQFAEDGIVTTVIERRHGPIDLVDFVELDLEIEEIEVLEQLNCQICVPFFGPAQLEGICFMSKVQAGDEYSAAETFALEMLSRQVREALWGQPGAAAHSNGDQARRSRGLQSVARQLHESSDEESILSRLAHALIGEMGIKGVAVLGLDEQGMRVRGAWGQALAENLEWSKVGPGAWDNLRAPAHLSEFEGDWAGNLLETGCSWFAPLAAGPNGQRALVIALRNPKDDSAIDADALESVTAQASYALSHADALDAARSRTLLVSRTLVTMIEKRLGHESSAETNLVAEYVARLAGRMNIERKELSDLLYGAIMRDIGMIQISDLVLKSPRKLSPEEWKLIQRHPIAGAEILERMGFSGAACEVVLHHHERFNGQGYPHGLRGTAIPVGARMVSVVESFVAMLRETPYRPALSKEEALSVLQENWEMRYDPNVIEEFISLMQVEQDPMDIDSLLVGQTPA